MIIQYRCIITNTTTWRDPNDDRIGGTIYMLDYWEFDTDTHTVATGATIQQDNWGDMPLGDTETIGVVWSECVPGTTTRRIWAHTDHLGNIDYSEDEQATECGWTGQTCDLQLTGTVVGVTATGVATGAHGTVRYSLDDGASSQTSPVFPALQLDTDYEMLAIDDGVGSSCRARWAFRISSATEPVFVPPAADPVDVVFSLHPLWHLLAVAPGQEAVLDLYVDHQHYGAFRRVVRLRARADAAGQAAFRLDVVLHRQLAAFVPPAAAEATLLSRRNVRNFLVRTALVEASTGAVGAFTTGPVRTVLRGGLPVERRDVAYLAERDALPAPPFLSWQPRGKRVTPAQPEWWLWLCPPGTPAQLTVCRRYQLPGAAGAVGAAERTLLREPVAVAPGKQSTSYRVLAVPLRQDAVEGAEQVELWLEDDQGTARSERIRFTVAPATERSRYFLFSNSLGGTDTLHATGRLEASLDTRQEVATQPQQPATSPTAALRFVASAEPTRRLKVLTGWLTAAQWDWLQEFVLARERWEWRGGRVLPLLLSKGPLTYAKDERPLSGYSFEYDYAADPVAYANLP